MQIIYNSLKSSDLDIIALNDPSRVTSVIATSLPTPQSPPAVAESLVHSVAEQINTARMAHQPAFKAVDLENMIADVIVETSAQGASLLEVHLIDPYWGLLRRNSSGWCFIDVDPDGSGYLWPPIEINFPPAVSDATWRLCQVKPTTDIGSANLILTFEDKIVAEMREHTGSGPDPTDPSLGSSNPQETRAEFVQRCVKTVSAHPLLKSDVGIRFIRLLDPADFTPADLVGSELTLPASATAPSAPAHRQNFTKSPVISHKTRKHIHLGNIGGGDFGGVKLGKIGGGTFARDIVSTIDTVVNEVSLAAGTVNGEPVANFTLPQLPPNTPAFTG